MRYSTWMIAGLLMFATTVFAQRTEEELNPKDPKAKEILDALSDKVKGYDSFSADFEYILVNKDAGINEKQVGSVQMKGEKKYRIDIDSREIVTDGESVWVFIKSVGELQISDMPEEGEDSENIMNPADAFHMYKNGFKYEHAGKATVDSKSADVIKMYPMDPGKKPFSSVTLNIDKAKLELISAVIKYKDGGTYTYRLKNFKANAALSNDFFEFDEDRDDVEDIIDNRF